MSTEASDHCPRCGGGFHCGANDAAPCACTAVQLDAVALAELRVRFAACLCLACLREIAASSYPSEPVQ
jgi:Cysteine-rich CWC